MRLKFIRQWLIGAAVTMAAPVDGIAREAGSCPSDEIVKCEAEISGYPSERTRLDWRGGEPLLADLLSDPICRAVMRRDGISAEVIHALAAHVRTSRKSLLNDA
jgi:hypothetical protein